MNIKPFLIIPVVLCLYSCKKDSNSNTIADTQIALAAPKVSGNQVVLSWSKLNNNSLLSYTIVKITDTTNIQSATFINVDKSENQYTDTLSVTPYIQYYIIGQLSTNTIGQPATILSNKETYVRTDIDFMTISPMDALYDKSDNELYIYSSTGDIAIYDIVNKKTIKQITTGARLGYCDLGTYNGKKELYVPRSDGWLFIYDASTLDQIDQINIGMSVYSVAYNNGMLFISGNNSNSNNIIFAYNRSSKSIISYQNSINNVRIKLIPGSNSTFLGMDCYDHPYACKFDNSGNYISERDGYFNGYSTFVSSFEIFPNGNSYISAPEGVIIDTNLQYVSSLPFGSNSLTAFAFDPSDRLIYAGTNVKTIQAYSMDNYQLTKTIGIQGYPVKIFYNNGSVISVSTTSSYNAYTFVEQY